MNRFAALAGILIALAASLPAQAQPGDGSRRIERFQQQREFQRQREQEFQRRQFEREEREGRPGRLSPEERQQLRRDIREHGRDVYRDRPRRF
jgi:Skp family chaperone for outer membrane proteins